MKARFLKGVLIPLFITGTVMAAMGGDASPLQVSVSFWDIGKCFPDGVQDQVYEQFKKQTGVVIKPVNVSWDDQMEKTQLWAASGDLPDVFVGAVRFSAVEVYKNWVSQGVVLEMPSDLSKYPNLRKYLQAADVAKYKDPDGKMYCIPRKTYTDPRDVANGCAVFARGDWLKACGFTNAPASMDEFLAVCKAFTEKDPDGDGKRNTMGMTAWNKQRGLYVMLALYPQLAGGIHWVKEDGKWIPALFSRNALPALTQYKKLYDSGYIDKDIPILKGTEGMDKFFGDRAGIFIHQNYLEPSQVSNFNGMHKGKTFGDLVTTIRLWPAKDGKRYYLDTDTCWSESYVSSAVSGAKKDAILGMFNWMMGQEWNDLRHYGIEGKDYKRAGDTIQVLRGKDDAGRYLPLSKQYPMLTMMNQFIDWDTGFKMFGDPTMDPRLQAVYADQRAWYHGTMSSNVDNWSVELMDVPAKAQVAGIDYLANQWKIIMSGDIAQTYAKVCDEMKKSGFSAYIDQVNAKAAKEGIR